MIKRQAYGLHLNEKREGSPDGYLLFNVFERQTPVDFTKNSGTEFV